MFKRACLQARFFYFIGERVEVPEPIFIDNHLLVINKPTGILVQGDRSGDLSLLDMAKAYIKEKYAKPGNVYLGLVHRLDRPASGLVVLARTSKAAARLSEQFRERRVSKVYLALVEGEVPPEAYWSDRIIRNGVTSRIGTNDEGGLARLSYRCIKCEKNVSLVEINLETGRHHQIRLQFSSRGFPLLGDFRYGSKITFGDKAIALHARSLTLSHPTKNEIMTFAAEPDNSWRNYIN